MRANNFNIRKSKFLEGIEIHFQSRLTVNKTKVSEDLNEKRSICHSPETSFPEFSLNFREGLTETVLLFYGRIEISF